MPTDSPPDRSRDWSIDRIVDRVLPALGALALVILVVAASIPTGMAAESGPTFEKNTIKPDEYGHATIPISVPKNGSVRLHIGGDDGSMAAEATVTDSNGDGTADVRIDTEKISGQWLWGTGGSEVSNVTVTERPADGSLAGDYDLTLGPDGEPTDIATLYVEPKDTSTGTPGETKTPTPVRTPVPKHLNGTTIVHTGKYVTLENDTRATVRGETHLPAGTKVTVRLRSRGETMPRFFGSRVVTVTADGTFSAMFDLSYQRGGDDQLADVSVHHNGTELTAELGRIRACSACTSPSAEPSPETAGPLAFENNTYNVIQTHEVVIPFTMGNESVATVVIGNEDTSGYELSARVNDSRRMPANGQGTLVFDTASVGLSSWDLMVSGNAPHDSDGTTVLSKTELSSLLDSGDYELRLYAGNGTAGEPADTATLVVHEPPTYAEVQSMKASPSDDSTARTERPTEADDGQTEQPYDRRLYGLGGLALGSGFGIAGVIVLLRRGV